jgi:hypothetical protein
MYILEEKYGQNSKQIINVKLIYNNRPLNLLIKPYLNALAVSHAR